MVIDSKARVEEAACVIAAVIYRDKDKQEILLGVRRVTPLSPRHPGVLSTPTLRVPADFMRAEVSRLGLNIAGAGMYDIHEARPFAVGMGGYYHGLDASFLDLLLCRKLGMSSSLTSATVHGVGQPRLLAIEDVADPLGTDRSEWTIMMTYEVVLDEGWDQFPTSSNSYSRLIWAKRDLVGTALRANDALLVDDQLNPFEVCIHGLCVRSAAFVLDQH